MSEPNQSIVEFVDNVLCNAICINASDIHFEVFESDFLIRYRVNGILQDHSNVDHEIGQPVITRIKVLAGLDIAESRQPQDGNICQTIGDSTVEFRVSTLPTQFGESVVLRVLQNNQNIPDIHTLASIDKNFSENLPNILHRSGMTILTGPTGCGKTTTIYSILNALNTDEVKILTCEDPVEYIVDEISQSNINDDIGFSFSRVLRSFLRHDPDIILVGEIRDHETAELAIRAALTGHTVFSTLHANDTVNAIPRLLDLGVQENMLAEAVNSIIAQRLVPIYEEGRVAGRKAIFETLIFSDDIKTAIKAKKSTQEIREIALAEGMIPLAK
ncbi:MAG: GspE/PulE family protein, partial [Opitutales bacterium]|nr:GspE/PulE family protein [Opitutales bacterium]